MAWKVPYTNITIGKIKNVDKPQPTRTQITEQIIARQQFRQVEDVKKWRIALQMAEDPDIPSRHTLIRIYKDVMLDGHISGIIKSIKNEVKAKQFMIVDADGQQDDEKTKLFKKKWFFKFIDHIVEAPFFGYSLVQLGDIVEDGFPNMKLVPRENIVPEWNMAKRDIFNTARKGFLYREPPLRDWFIYIGEEDDNMGWLNGATPHALSKKNLFAEMWEFAEIFGMPIRQGRTDIHDTEKRKNMEEMMQRMGSAAWGVFDREDEIVFAEAAKGDAKVFIEPIKLDNEEISKGFAGQVAVFDEKAYVGSAEVQERLFQKFIITFMRQAEFVINDDLLPRMVIHRILPDGFFFKWKSDETLTAIEKKDIIKDLLPLGVRYSAETIEESTGIKVESVGSEEPEAPEDIATIMNDVAKLYENFIPIE